MLWPLATGTAGTPPGPGLPADAITRLRSGTTTPGCPCAFNGAAGSRELGERSRETSGPEPGNGEPENERPGKEQLGARLSPDLGPGAGERRGEQRPG